MTLALSLLTILAVLAQVRSNGTLLGARLYRGGLVALTVLSIGQYTHWLQFHGARTWVHWHDVAHYYLGSKYFRELGYGTLYIALLRAEYDDLGRLESQEARDLSGNFLVPAALLLNHGGEVRARFSQHRWKEFCTDAAFFRRKMGAGFQDVLRDHGYNPTPVWTLIGGTLSNCVPAGSESGIRALTFIDPCLVAVAIAMVASTFGVETALLIVIYRCICFGAEFDWIGGAFAREATWSSLLLMATFLGQGQPSVAGGFLGIASMLRTFPALLATGIASNLLWAVSHRRELDRSAVRFATAMAVACGVLLVASAVWEGGFQVWLSFFENIARHSQGGSSNVIGLTHWVMALRAVDSSTTQGVAELVRWHATAARIQLLTVTPLAVAYVVIRSREQSVLEILGLGVFVIFAGLNLSAYYYAMLALLIIVYREDHTSLAWLFAVELGVQILGLVERQAVMLYMYKSLLLLGALVLISLRRSRLPEEAHAA